MSVTSSRWAAGLGALAALVTGGLLAFRDGSLLAWLAVIPLFAGLVGAAFQRTWGVFATLGGAALVLVAFGVGEVPAWAAMVAVAGVAVVTPTLIRAFRFDAVAAAAWMALSGLTGGAAALAWNELDAPAPVAADLDKPVARDGFVVEVDWGTRDERPCDHRRGRRHHHRRWGW